jgi:hypothetical protein
MNHNEKTRQKHHPASERLRQESIFLIINMLLACSKEFKP